MNRYSLRPARTVKTQSAVQALLLLLLLLAGTGYTARAQYGTYDIQLSGTVTAFSYEQIPADLVATTTLTGVTYQWEQSDKPLPDPGNFISIAGAHSDSYSFTASLDHTTWFRRVTYVGSVPYISNIVKVEVVSVNWEDRNYMREHDILISGQTDWKAIDKLPVGRKLQTTTYLDGLGRTEQKVSREAATPADPANATALWGDVVQFTKYDAYGRQQQQYLPYTTTTESGKHKSAYETEQATYYTNRYNETYPYSQTQYEGNPLSRTTNVKAPGTSWAAGPGNGAAYDGNETNENVRIWTIGYNTGDAPASTATYTANSLYKTITTDENGKNVIKYTDKVGQLILTKTQLDNSPAAGHDGWMCVYNVYDGFGRLRYVLQPEAVKWLNNNGWSFSATDGPTVLAEQCSRYEYDEKGRTIRKKNPGADELRMVYDKRDRLVLIQDGAQAAKPTHNGGDPEWTLNLYDELDRVQIVALYHTTQDMSSLQTAAGAAGSNTTITTTVPAQAIINRVVTTRPATNPTPPATYTAQQTIEFAGEFESIGTTDAFEAYIDPAATTPATTVANTVHSLPVPATDIGNPAITTLLKYLYYDDYSYTGAKPFDTRFENSQAYASGGQPIATTARTLNMPTGVRVRVLGTATFLSSTLYYDEDGLPVQSLEDNIKSGTDTTTSQYGWDGRLLSTHTRHSTGSTGYADFSIITRNVYDKIGRVVSLEKKIGTNAFTPIATYDMDDMGRLKTKRLHPDYSGPHAQTGGGLESLAYSYNLHSNITGINKDYALKATGYDKWAHYFGLYLGYDKRDAVFVKEQLDGHVAGLLWSTQGDDAQRKYDYTYDNAGRLTKAAFTQKQKPTDTWDNTKLDFTVGGNTTNNDKITYDLNGNLLNMLQRGVQIGQAAPVTIDDLQYEYMSYSNKLKKVTDAAQSTIGSFNGVSGDFKDGSNGSADDYVYDENGNLVVDLNKNAKELANVAGADGIRYNFLDKPEEIRIPGKGTIKMVYDADANRLQKIYTPDGANAITKTTTYINGFVYEEKSNVPGGAKLQYLNFEEGRIRVVQPVVQSNGYDYLSIAGNLTLLEGQQGSWDYMVRDYQQNVRVILTEETHLGSNKCTMEGSRQDVEKLVFGQPGNSNEVVQTQWAKSSIPDNAWPPAAGDEQASMLSQATHKIGPNTLLKVMAGDEITAAVQYYYKNQVSNGPGGGTLLSQVVASLVQTLTSTPMAGSPVHSGAAGVGTNLQSGPNVGALAALTDPNTTTPDDKPKAYLTVLFFDERMELVTENSQAVRVGDPGSVLTMGLTSIQAPKNGYAYVYVSNESSEPVYFDNLQVADNRGRIVEENHYYAYGLKIAAISSSKLPDDNEGHVLNPYLYGSKELTEEGDLDWAYFDARYYDAQIGRWPVPDPLHQFASPYEANADNPINYSDPTGKFAWGLAISTTVGAYAGGALSSGNLNPLKWNGDGWKGAAAGAIITAAVSTVGEAIFGKGDRIFGLSAKTSQKVLAISEGVVQNVLSIVKDKIDNEESLTSGDLLGAAVSGAVSGYFAAGPVQDAIDSKLHISSKLFMGVVSTTLGSLISTGIKDVAGGKKITLASEVSNGASATAAQFAYNETKNLIRNNSKTSKLISRISSNIVGSITGAVFSNVLKNDENHLNAPLKSTPFKGVFNLRSLFLNLLPGAAGGYLNDTKYSGGDDSADKKS